MSSTRTNGKASTTDATASAGTNGTPDATASAGTNGTPDATGATEPAGAAGAAGHGAAWWVGNSRALLRLALPLILTNFAYVALTTVDIVMLGRLGAVEIAAAGLAIALFNQLRTTGTGLVTGVSNLVAEARVRDDRERIGALLFAGFFWATVCGAVFCAVLLLIGPLLVLLGQDPAVVGKAGEFLAVLAPGMLPCLWFQNLRHFTTGLKRPGPLLAITLASVVVTIGLNYALIYGRFGLPAFGFVGVAIATVTVFLLSFLAFTAVILRDGVLRPYLTSPAARRWSGDAVGSVWRLGLPISGTYASEAGFFSVLTLVIGSLGVDALAAQTVLNQIVYIAFMVSAGLSHAASIHISEAAGADDYVTARRTGLLGTGWGVVAMLAVAVAYLAFPEPIVSLFISAEHAGNADILALTATGLLIAALMQVFDAAQNIGNGILRGIGDTAGPFRISLVGYWLIGLPAGCLLGLVADWGVEGVWIGQTIGLAATAAILLVAFLRRVDRLHRASAGAPVPEPESS
ncbi:MATE family efflux transporter [Streptomyces pacificus]|uniref:Probable multidrug resistance protein NorM n=1 Tax=Streptomyces pacificus TaxID=2705029 RepID=A0A6A0B615_9ACTN|nr:MATE family efflux transporter [Streptomyces pacificus]GFH39127.1 MATE family efflux transporter [Streptomyces pacificus]